MGKKQKETAPQREVTFGRLSAQSFPEIWSFQIMISIILAIPAAFMMKLIEWVAGIGGEVITTANIKSFILSWRFPVILILGFLLILVFLVFELFAQIYLTENILKGEKAGIRKCLGSGIKAVKKFLNPAGLKIIIFIFIAVPLCGVGFSLSLTRSLYIPNFIMEVVFKKPLLTAIYIAAVVCLIVIALMWIFCLHAVLIDGMKPDEAMKRSSSLVKENLGKLLKGLIVIGLAVLAIMFVSNILFSNIPGWILGEYGETMPKGYWIDVPKMIEEGKALTDQDLSVISYRIGAAFAVLLQKYLISVVILLCGAYFMLRLNRYYYEFTGRDQKLWLERPRNGRYVLMAVWIVLVIGVNVLGAVATGFLYNNALTREEPAKIVAHRAGGTMASENSIEGLEKAIEHGCYACEIDIHRTKDGHYIINHDNDFKRLTGVDKKPKDMTLEEIKQLRIKDTTGSGKELTVPTLEEMLDVIKGKVKLFIEFKGPTADQQMADDVVKIIREYDCLEDTALISLDYNIINYTETNYPEFETGTLFFASIGDVSKLNCDLIIMEEETATEANVDNTHEAGKQAIVWTVNTEEGMYNFLDSEVDAVITDEIILAEKVQAMLDDRTDLEVMEDKLNLK